MLFYFHGVERLSLFWITPNRCAVALGMAVLVLAGALSAVWRTDRLGRYGRAVLMAGGGGIFGVLLLLCALTYSRGGDLAILCGFITFLVLFRGHRGATLLAILAFVAMVLAVPEGMLRVNSIGQVTTDPSIHNRLVLWRGVLAMIADHWRSGMPLADFWRNFCAWYQPAEMHQLYLTAVNDFLTIGVWFGLPGLALYLEILSVLLWFGLRLAKARQNSFLCGLLAAVVCYLIASLFSTFVIQARVVSIFAAVALLLVAVLVCNRDFFAAGRWRPAFFQATFFCGALVMVIAGGAMLAARSYEWKLRCANYQIMDVG